MRVMGIDPGLTATGYGILDFSGSAVKLIETGTIEPRRSSLFQAKLQKVHSILINLIRQHKPQVMVLEKLYAHHRHPTTAGIMGHVRGVICLASAQGEIPLIEYSVKRIRQAVTGKGNATKQQTLRMVAHLLNISEDKLTLDASDALALALGYGRMHRQKI